MSKTIVLMLLLTSFFQLGLAGRGKMIDVTNSQRPGAKDVIRVEIVDVIEKKIGDRREMVLCVKMRNVTKMVVSTQLQLSFCDRPMKLPVFPLDLEPGGFDMAIARIDLRHTEGLDMLSEIKATISDPSYKPPK